MGVVNALSCRQCPLQWEMGLLATKHRQMCPLCSTLTADVKEISVTCL